METSTQRTLPFKLLLLAGLLVGTLDMTAAVIVSGASLASVSKFIASGVFGREAAFAGGTNMIVWGILFHYVIAFLWTIVFFLIYSRVPFLSKNRIVGGIVVGLTIWCLMNLVVLPLSNVPDRPIQLRGFIVGASVLIAMIGIPLMFIFHRYSPKAKRQFHHG